MLLLSLVHAHPTQFSGSCQYLVPLHTTAASSSGSFAHGCWFAHDVRFLHTQLLVHAQLLICRVSSATPLGFSVSASDSASASLTQLPLFSVVPVRAIHRVFGFLLLFGLCFFVISYFVSARALSLFFFYIYYSVPTRTFAFVSKNILWSRSNFFGLCGVWEVCSIFVIFNTRYYFFLVASTQT